MELDKLQTEHPKIDVVQCDITVRPDVLALVETVRDRYGKIDVLVNNAGIIERVNFLEESVSDERIAYEIAVNLRGPILLTRRLLPLLRSGRNPMIVMVKSGYALLPPRALRPTPRLRTVSAPSRWRYGASCVTLGSALSKYCHRWLELRQRVRSVKRRCAGGAG
jgi:short-subunit dehydrogenase involved in D-alanine esterification of teichoic acids